VVINKRSKLSRQRGTHTHGWGSKKKHRGAGNRGGRGNAGSGKRGDAKKPGNWSGRYFGKYGFNKVNKVIFNPINIRMIEDNIDRLIAESKAKKEGEFYLMDILDLNCNKLLATGKATKKMKITTKYASKSAIEKIKSAGGEVILTGAQDKKN